MIEEQPKYSNKPYTDAQLEYFKEQSKADNYFANRAKKHLDLIEEYKRKQMAYGKPLIPKNIPGIKYFMIEDGTFFKANMENLETYRLDLDLFQWIEDPALISIFMDNMMKFNELHDFTDIFPDKPKNTLNKGI